MAAAICFGIVSYGHFYRGRMVLGWVFALLTLAQLALALTKYIILRKEINRDFWEEYYEKQSFGRDRPSE